MFRFELNLWFRFCSSSSSSSLPLLSALTPRQICSLRDPDFLKYFKSLSQSHSLIEVTVAKDSVTRSDPNSSSTTPPEDGASGPLTASNQTQAVGWFYETEYEAMRKLVKRIITRRIDEFILRQQQILALSSQDGETMRVTKAKHTAFEGDLHFIETLLMRICRSAHAGKGFCFNNFSELLP
jgi:hypothetical protein